MNETPPTTAPRFFQPVTLLVGLVLGLVTLSWAGRAVTRHNWHRDFQRFHPLIAPESHYQPTIAEMRAIIRDRCRPDQILVVVGGNSVFQGVGQPVEQLWTRHLQDLLGERYAVVNLAFRGASPTDGGALAAESLRDEFPRQIYLANVPPFTGASPAGNLDYRFMLFDAQYKGWLLDFAPRLTTLEDYLAHPKVYPAARETSLAGRLDAWLRFRELWNWWSVTRFFTFPTSLTPERAHAFRARNEFPDMEPDFAAIPFNERFPGKSLPVEMQIVRNVSAQFYEPVPGGGWKPNEFERQQFRKIARAAFPAPLKRRTLIVLSPNAPYYVRQLTPAEQERDRRALADSLVEWQAQGYAAAVYGDGFTDSDFGDRTHLTASGGRKMAAQLAPAIRSLAGKLGYPAP
ncbi:MAG: hypothetical protein ACOZE5_03830 [Verrucomicrobiota bacterium]